MKMQNQQLEDAYRELSSVQLKISLFRVYQEVEISPAVELHKLQSLHRDGRLDQLLSPAFPSGLAGASLRDISDGYQRADRPYIKAFSYDRLPVRVMLSA